MLISLAVPDWLVWAVVLALAAQAVATAWLHLTTLGLRDLHEETMRELRRDIAELQQMVGGDAEDDTGCSCPMGQPAPTSTPIVINVNRGMGGDDPSTGEAAPTHDGRRSRVISPSVLLMTPTPTRASSIGGGNILQRAAPVREAEEYKDN